MKMAIHSCQHQQQLLLLLRTEARCTARIPRRRLARCNLSSLSGSFLAEDNDSFPYAGFGATAPPPVRYPRKALKLPLAVLLLRSVYDSVDDLNIFPMNEFQVQFWKKRQAEYEPYVLQHYPIPIQQGDLSNAIYFDFISYAQFLTVNTAIEKSTKLFEELDGAEGVSKTIQRSELLGSKRSRAESVAQVAGAKIFQGLSEGFQGLTFSVPGICDPNDSASDRQRCVEQGIDQISNALVTNGYAVKGQTQTLGSSSSGGLVVKTSLQAPANLWSRQFLENRHSFIKNDVFAFVVCHFLKTAEAQATYSVDVGDDSIDYTFNITL